jgi:uncharacterized protein (TIGR02996 family)
MTAEKGFLRAILDDPDDESHRLIFADWLEENGDPERAAFVRAQVAFARACRAEPYLDDWHWRAYGENLDDCEVEPGYEAWERERVDFVQTQHELAWLGGEADPEGVRWAAREPPRKWRRKWDRVFEPSLSISYSFRAGMPERLAVDPLLLESFGEDYFRAAPIREAAIRRSNADMTSSVAEDLALPYLGRLSCLHFVNVRECLTVVRALANATHLSRLSSLWLENANLGDEGLAILASCPHLAGLTELHVERNSITTEGVRALTRSPHLTRLRHLYLGGNPAVGAAGVYLLAAWPVLAGLDTLDVACCGLGDEGTAAVAAVPFEGLTRLYLGYNGVGRDGCSALVRADGLSRLRTLDLSRNPIEGGDVGRLAVAPLAGELRLLNLSSTGLGDGAVEALAGSRRLEKLAGLLIGDNAITGLGLRALATSRHLPRLCWLDASDCAMEFSDMTVLPRSSTLQRLRHLDLSENLLRDAGVEALAEWPGLKPVTSLRLRDVGLTDAGVVALAGSPHLTACTSLDVRDNALRRKGQKALRERFGRGVEC